MNPAIVQNLIDLGMTEREAKLYLAMLDRSEATASELHRMSGVIRSKTYETLVQMVARGFCQERVEGRKKFYSAMQPDALLELFQHRWVADLKRKTELGGDVAQNLMDRFQQGRQQERPLDFIEVLQSREQIHRRFMQLVNGNRESVYAFMCPPYVSIDPDVLEEQETAIRKSYERGVTSRGIYQVNDENWPWLHPHLERSREQGEEVRVTDDLPVKMFVFDAEIVQVALPSNSISDSEEFVMMVVQDKSLARAFTMLFKTIWDHSSTLEEWELNCRKQ